MFSLLGAINLTLVKQTNIISTTTGRVFPQGCWINEKLLSASVRVKTKKLAAGTEALMQSLSNRSLSPICLLFLNLTKLRQLILQIICRSVAWMLQFTFSCMTVQTSKVLSDNFHIFLQFLCLSLVPSTRSARWRAEGWLWWASASNSLTWSGSAEALLSRSYN